MVDQNKWIKAIVEKFSSTFVQKNPAQLTKQLLTHTKSNHPEVVIIADEKEVAIVKVMSVLDVRAVIKNLYVNRNKKRLNL